MTVSAAEQKAVRKAIWHEVFKLTDWFRTNANEKQGLPKTSTATQLEGFDDPPPPEPEEIKQTITGVVVDIVNSRITEHAAKEAAKETTDESANGSTPPLAAEAKSRLSWLAKAAVVAALGSGSLGVGGVATWIAVSVIDRQREKPSAVHTTETIRETQAGSVLQYLEDNGYHLPEREPAEAKPTPGPE